VIMRELGFNKARRTVAGVQRWVFVKD
jgi:hypothetical protein